MIFTRFLNSIRKGDLETFKLVYPKILDVNDYEDDINLRTPIYLACSYGRSEMVKTLLQNPNIKPNKQVIGSGWTPLHVACSIGSYYTVDALLKNSKVDVNRRSKNGSTALWISAEKGRFLCVFLLLLNERVDLNIINKFDKTSPEHVAKRETQLLFKVFKEKGFDLFNKEFSGFDEKLEKVHIAFIKSFRAKKRDAIEELIIKNQKEKEKLEKLKERLLLDEEFKKPTNLNKTIEADENSYSLTEKESSCLHALLEKNQNEKKIMKISYKNQIETLEQTLLLQKRENFVLRDLINQKQKQFSKELKELKIKLKQSQKLNSKLIEQKKKKKDYQKENNIEFLQRRETELEEECKIVRKRIIECLSSKKEGENECCICYERKADHVLAPCGHTLCGICSKKVNECPKCRTNISSVVRVFS